MKCAQKHGDAGPEISFATENLFHILELFYRKYSSVE